MNGRFCRCSLNEFATSSSTPVLSVRGAWRDESILERGHVSRVAIGALGVVCGGAGAAQSEPNKLNRYINGPNTY